MSFLVNLIKHKVARFSTNVNNNTALVGPKGIIPLDKPRSSISSLPTVMAFGNSIARQNQIGYNTNANQVAYYAQLWWALVFAGQPFSWVQTGPTVQLGADAGSTYSQGIYGYGGATSTGMLPFFAQTVGNEVPDYCFFHAMENDVNAIVSGTMTRDEAKANYLSLIETSLAQGTIPIWVGCLPSKSYTLATHAAEYWALTDYVESLQGAHPGMIYVPVHDLYMDSALTTPQPLSAGIYANYTDASVHPVIASPLIGMRIADVLESRNISGFGLVPGPGDARYLWGNAYMSGVAGTVSASLTAGTCPTNLTVNSNATVVGTPAVVDYSNKQALEIPITSGTSVGLQNMWALYTADKTLASVGAAVGDVVQVFHEVTIDAATTLTGLRDIYNELNFTGASGYPSSFKKPSADLFNTITIPKGRKMLFATPMAAIPTGCTGLRPYLFATASKDAASLAGKFTVTKFALVDWSKSS